MCETCYGEGSGKCLECRTPNVLLGGKCVAIDQKSGVCDGRSSERTKGGNAGWVYDNEKGVCDGAFRFSFYLSLVETDVGADSYGQLFRRSVREEESTRSQQVRNGINLHARLVYPGAISSTARVRIAVLPAQQSLKTELCVKVRSLLLSLFSPQTDLNTVYSLRFELFLLPSFSPFILYLLLDIFESPPKRYLPLDYILSNRFLLLYFLPSRLTHQLYLYHANHFMSRLSSFLRDVLRYFNKLSFLSRFEPRPLQKCSRRRRISMSLDLLVPTRILRLEETRMCRLSRRLRNLLRFFERSMLVLFFFNSKGRQRKVRRYYGWMPYYSRVWSVFGGSCIG